MNTRRFLPASILQRHRDFGRVVDAIVDYDEPLRDGVVAAALYQHYVAYTVRESLASSPDLQAALRDLAARLRVSPGWLQRKLHGQASASLDEMAEWLIELDLPAPSFELAVDAAVKASPFDRNVVVVSAADLSLEELGRVQAEQLEMIARLKTEVGK
ncbi:MAG TPA: hypothetical protein VFN54_08870 [Acidimicrobiales bacterium]|nr:hypothetical protein [Acidimicrobiales bacterium]